jgi:hypothetical protein
MTKLEAQTLRRRTTTHRRRGPLYVVPTLLLGTSVTMGCPCTRVLMRVVKDNSSPHRLADEVN